MIAGDLGRGRENRTNPKKNPRSKDEANNKLTPSSYDAGFGNRTWATFPTLVGDEHSHQSLLRYSCQGGRRLGDETSGRTGTSALSALPVPGPVRILDAKSCFCTNQKWIFLFEFISRAFHLVCRQHLMFNKNKLCLWL